MSTTTPIHHTTQPSKSTRSEQSIYTFVFTMTMDHIEGLTTLCKSVNTKCVTSEHVPNKEPITVLTSTLKFFGAVNPTMFYDIESLISPITHILY
jgi:hypothetical protein